jgi:hypothetical protein
MRGEEAFMDPGSLDQAAEQDLGRRACGAMTEHSGLAASADSSAGQR